MKQEHLSPERARGIKELPIGDYYFASQHREF
jgi:hypothetical protein